MENNTICPSCQSELKLREGFSKKNGKPYSFWGCTNFPACTFTRPNTDKVAPPQSKAPIMSNQSDNRAFELQVVSLLTQILAELKKGDFPEPPIDEDLEKYGING